MKATSFAGLILVVSSAACTSGVYVGSAPRSAPAPSAAPVVVSATIVLTNEQIAAVRSHYGPGRGNGRGRGGGLPPGIARNLERGKPLPPGIAKQYLPNDLIVTLPRLDNGLEYIVAGGKLLLVEAATQVVRDVLIDALFG
jgi:hypothetical protein